MPTLSKLGKLLAACAACGPLAAGSAPPPDELYEADMAFALDQLEQRCGHFFERKDIDWKKVRREFEKSAKSVSTESGHLELMIRLLARLEDGHAEVRKLPKGEAVEWPAALTVERRSPGLALCEVGRKVYVKTAFGDARELGVEPGMEVLVIADTKVHEWIEERTAQLRDHMGFSTDQQARFYTMHWGLAQPEGTRIDIELKSLDGKKRKRTLMCSERNFFDGPAVAVADLDRSGQSIYHGRTPSGFAYLHVRRVEDAILAELDAALAAQADAPGLILDFRGNSGGGCDHDAFEARFVPPGAELERLARAPLASQGAHPYAGPMIVIVDATCRSSGETLAGMFKEDGRAFMIGESATAGMSSQKETIELPSGLFALYVSVGSNRSSFNDGEGIEGLGVPPDELVEYVPEELAAGVDTVTARAEALLAKFPQDRVRYDPADHGWKQ